MVSRRRKQEPLRIVFICSLVIAAVLGWYKDLGETQLDAEFDQLNEIQMSPLQALVSENY